MRLLHARVPRNLQRNALTERQINEQFAAGRVVAQQRGRVDKWRTNYALIS